ncbi:hypothetical protein [Anoxybacillus flavithermus]|uniref:hypothetical protein n=1 Tax=Anoxybacillus flavithermus TaxID=33934 RepID=UPI00186867C6|nr:hypothetical protein [Anoxybacillus flavithermus]MBE2945898.1 hypothetical protein [Anoxybacillus flavithermus]MBE2948724.1 hypothetical protein [Anoxybacillus flavithermus]
MADKNIQMTQRNTSNTGWDNLYPITKASNVQVTPISGLSGTDVQTVLKNLFQFANSGKNSVASAIGSPASSSDTFSQLATHITNHKTSLANSLGSGSGVDSLQTLVNMRLQDLKNMLATNLTNKGQTASGTETLLNLINKVLNINTGKRWASGTATSSSSTGMFRNAVSKAYESYWYVHVTGLAISNPSLVIVYRPASNELIIYCRGVSFITYGGDIILKYRYPYSMTPLENYFMADLAPVESNQFKLPVDNARQSYNWLVIE